MPEATSFPLIAFDISFGKCGSAESFQRLGWSHPESGFTWSLGARSTLYVPLAVGWKEILLILEGSPFLCPPSVVSQRVTIVVSGIEVCTFLAVTAFKKSFCLRGITLENTPFIIELRYPDRAAPSAFGAEDRRELAIAWSRMRISLVHPAREPFARTSSDKLTGDHGQSKVRVGRKSIEVAQARAESSQRSLERLVLNGLVSGNLASAASAVEIDFDLPSASMEIDATLTDDFSVARCTINIQGYWTFGFSPAWLGKDSDPAAIMVVWHWLATLPILEAYSASRRIPGSFLLSLGDEAHARGVAFCANTSEAFLIPDPYFMRSMGYRDSRHNYTSLRFMDRRRSALWRGSTTGYRGLDGLLGLPRVRLCILALQASSAEFINAGLTGFVQLDPGEEKALREMGLARPFISPEQLPEWMFHIDIDGNTNSWPGLFQKLLSGGVVLKVASVGQWRQWYYHRLEAHINMMPIAADLGDLVDTVKHLACHTDEAAALAEGAQSLVRSMSYTQEVQLAVSTLEDAIIQEWLQIEDAGMVRNHH